MAYLPGTPQIGQPSGIAATAHAVGKPGRTQDLGSVVGRTAAGTTTIAGGDPSMHAIGHYGKTGAGASPAMHAGAQLIRGGSGGSSRHIRQGGLGPGKLSTPGTDDNYSLSNNQDTE